MSKILVTGGCGYIGSHVVRQLSELGHLVVVVDDLSTGRSSALLSGEILIEGDAGDAANLERIFRAHQIDAILHFAGKIRVEESVADPGLYYQGNTVKTLNLLRTALRFGVKHLVFSSTAAVYGQPDQVPVSEQAATAPASPYGMSKLLSEQIIRDLAGRDSAMTTVILRYFNVAGADPGGRLGQLTPNATHLIKVACEAALRRRRAMAIYGTDYPTRDGTCIRDFIHVEDLASAHVAVLNYLFRGGASARFNCGYGRGATVREVIEMVKSVSGVDFPVELAPRRAGDVVEMVAAAERIRALVGWEPRFADLRTIVQHAFAWEASH